MELLLIAVRGLFEQSGLEIAAMLLAIAYLVLIIRRNILAWPCAFLSTSIYIYVFWEAALPMESVLNVYYLLMAVYGFWQWNKKTESTTSQTPIINWPLQWHLLAISGVLFISVVSGYLLSENTNAAWPYLDSFTTWAAVLTTFMVTRKVFENWYYWLVINSVALFLYIDRALYPTALLMSIYIVLIFVGIYQWRVQMKQQMHYAQ